MEGEEVEGDGEEPEEAEDSVQDKEPLTFREGVVGEEAEEAAEEADEADEGEEADEGDEAGEEASRCLYAAFFFRLRLSYST